MSRRMVLLLAITCAVAVGNIYFPQAIGPLVADGLRVSPDSAAVVVTATQVGYTAGIVLLVPLGDRIPHRTFLAALLGLTGLALLAAGCAPALRPLVAASALVGLTTVAAQIVGPLAAGLVAADRRGAVIGTLLSGSTGGMLLARTFSGTLGEWLGWRAPYLVAAVLALLLATVLAFAVPATAPASRQSYPALLAEPLRLLRTEPELRRSCWYQATVFAGFSAVWTCLALLLTSPAYGLGAQAVGMLALVGGATMLCTPLAGRLVDRRGPDPVNLVCLLGVLLSAAILTAGALGGTPGLAALTVGTLLLDVAMQCGMVANQARVYALRPDARSRLNTAYMTCAYLGGSAGSWLGVRAWGRAGWWGVCALVALLTVLALVRHPPAIRRPRRSLSVPAQAPCRDTAPTPPDPPLAAR
ncbi:MFS transporter [Streptomyces rapamycinicus]|uniref:MFS transporter n=2 Tax=Streptomyces rapamycinicus TaxID=1226757 RepID=A0A3L8R7G0_STRRN|nr:MFS transporter [Streptomyces rapamycinicus]MBB4779865.1 putative MFS family arabinose efflux permease [Streptomyces rapamycinicus]RLV75480.1 MFS transporter [Streptomyces rapamycinicus NRRL 5491]UTP28578.1 MFS transporter [Streptomyces rapamycinicus NRRL 5491]